MKFALLVARQRSGTGAFGSVLDQHPDIKYVGEVFHPANFGQPDNYFTFLHALIKQDPDRALPNANERNFGDFLRALQDHHGQRIMVIDIKYRSLHHLNGGWQGLVERPWILSHAAAASAPVIHLTRRNLVESFVSGRLAEANKIWHARQGDQIVATSGTVNIRDLIRYMDTIDREVALVTEWLGGLKRVFTVDYGELFDASGDVAAPVADAISTLLGVAPFQDRAPAFVKQAPPSLRQSIENFDAVTAELALTRWAWMVSAEGSDKPAAAAPSPSVAPPVRLPAARSPEPARLLLHPGNRIAEEKVTEFRKARPPGRFGVIDAEFHRYKNRFPYHGFVEVDIFGSRFVMLSTNDDLVAMTFFWHGPSSYEPMSMKLWAERVTEASTVFDIGAFSGVYSLHAAICNPKCRIVAFEAARRTYGRLLSNIQANGLPSRITPVNKAIARGRGFEIFHRFRGENILGIGDSFVAKDIAIQASEERVATISIDEYLAEADATAPDLIKIDVEGAETLALEGMATLLSERRPTVLVEVTPKTAGDVKAMLERHRYSLRAIDEGAMALRSFEGATRQVVNLLAERVGD